MLLLLQKGKTMRTNIIKIGNSKGIIIPSKALKTLGLKDSVELEVHSHTITIRGIEEKSNPFDKISHGGWFNDSRDAHEISRELSGTRVNSRPAVEL